MKKAKILNIILLILIIATIVGPPTINASELFRGSNIDENNTLINENNSRDIVSGGNGNTGQSPYTYYDYNPGDGDFRGYFREGTTYGGSTAQFVTSNVAYNPKNTFMMSFTDGYMQYINGSTTTPPIAWNSLSQIQKDKMGMAYSYGAKKAKEDEDLDWLLAVSMLIENQGNIIDTSSFPPELKAKVEAINTQVQYYNSSPSFMSGINGGIELTWNLAERRYQGEFTDTTGVFDEKWLASFLEADGTVGLHFEDPVGENNILIYTDDPTVSTTLNMTNDYMPEDDFTFSDGVTTIAVPTNLTFYTTTYNHGTVGAPMVTGIDYEAKLNPTITVKEAKGTIELSNCGYIEDGSCTPLEGSVFTLEDEEGNILDIETTDANGQIIFSDVGIGNYKVYQTSVLEDYEINDTVYNVTVEEDGEIVQVNSGNYIENKKIKGTVSLRKVGIKSNIDSTLYPLEGVEFTIYKDENEDGILGEEDIEEEVLITDVNGEIFSSELNKGSYIIVETATIDGYINNEYEEHFIISTNDNIELNGGMDLTNDIKSGQVEVSTVGVDGQESILLANTQLLIYKDENSNNNIDEEDVKIETMTTDANGYALSSNLIYGDYILVENNVDENYILNDEQFTFSIKGDKEVVKVNDGNAIENQKVLEDTGKLRVHKVDEDENPLEGVEFTIYKDENTDGILDKEDSKVNTLSTDSNGNIIFEDLEYEQYILKETKGLKGYINTGEEFVVNISDENVQSLEVVNKKEFAEEIEEVKGFLNTHMNSPTLLIPLLCVVIIKLKY